VCTEHNVGNGGPADPAGTGTATAGPELFDEDTLANVRAVKQGVLAAVFAEGEDGYMSVADLLESLRNAQLRLGLSDEQLLALIVGELPKARVLANGVVVIVGMQERLIETLKGEEAGTGAGSSS